MSVDCMPGAAEGGQCFDVESFENAKQMDDNPQPDHSKPLNVGSIPTAAVTVRA